MLEINKEIRYDLESRIVKNSNKKLLIFPNRQIMEWTKRWFQGSKDIIYLTENELYNHGLVGLHYGSYEFADEVTLMRIKKGIEIAKSLEKEVDENE